MTKKLVPAAVIAVAVAVSAYWYWSPHLAMNSMKTAARERNAEAFNSYVDYPKVRESLKGQFSAKMAGALSKVVPGSNGLESAGTSFGVMLGMALVDKFIDAMVQPQAVMKAMAEARLEGPGLPKRGDSGTGSPPDAHWTIERVNVDRVIAFGTTNQQEPVAKQVGFVFDRSGFATWRLTEIRLPAGD